MTFNFSYNNILLTYILYQYIIGSFITNDIFDFDQNLESHRLYENSKA